MKIKKTFYDWCIENNRNDLLEMWDYNKNKKTPKDYSYGSGYRAWFIVDDKHSYDYKLSTISTNNSDVCNKYNNSFGKYLIDEYGETAIDDYWSDKNDISPYDVFKSSKKEVWIKCLKTDYHDDYLIETNHFYQGNRCPYCSHKKIHYKDSFAQYHIDRVGENFLKDYWSDKNTLDPWSIPPRKNSPKIWIKCQNVDYHEYDVTPSNFTRGYVCPYCNKKRVMPQDSLGALYPDILNIWSEKNDKSPYEYRKSSNCKVWLKCENGKHDDYQRMIVDYTNCDATTCPKCSKEERYSKFERKTQEYLSNYKYTILHEYDCNINPINPRTKRILPFDNEIVELKLVIEVNGQQHYYYKNGWFKKNKRFNTREEYFADLKWRDNYKKNYAISNGYEYLELPYWTFDDDTYKKLIDDKITMILNNNNQESVTTAGVA